MLALYRAFVRFLPGRERALAISIFLLPSVLFWASGVIKESLLFLGLGLLLWQMLKILNGEFRWTGLLLLGGTGLLLFHLKFYVIACLLPALALLVLSSAAPRVPLVLRTLLVVLCSVALGMNLHHLLPSFNVLEIMAVKQRDFIGLSQATGAGSFVMPVRLEPNAWSFLQQAPYAVYITLLGPLVHAGSGAFGVVSAAENAVLIILLACMLVYRLPIRSVELGLLTALLTYVVLLALVIGWTTPVMGAIVRYRTPLLPFLLIAALLVVDHRKLLSRWPKLKPVISA